MTVTVRVIDILEPILVLLFRSVRRVERFLGPEDDWVEEDRRILYEAADAFLRPLGRPTVREKTPEDYVTTVHADSNLVEGLLHEYGYERNTLSTRKYRRHHEGGKQWAEGSWVIDPDDTRWQHHVYLFEAPNGGTDVYAHTEPSVMQPKEHHLSEDAKKGTAMELYHIFERVGIEYGEREIATYSY